MITEQVTTTDLNEFCWCSEHPQDDRAHDPAQKLDLALEERIHDALWKDAVLRATDISEIDVHVKNGIVYLRGHLLSGNNRQRVEKALQEVDGIPGIRSSFVMDEDLKYQIAMSLAQLEQANQCKFFTGVSHGVVVLNGEVPSASVRLSAELCAASNPKVRGVINYIHITGETPALDDTRFLQPPIGKEICFLDGVHGIVRQVVISPGNRRVTAMTIQGRFLSLNENSSTLNSGPMRPVLQVLLIPMNVVGHLTNSSGFLTIPSSDNKNIQNFDAHQFVAPGKGWEPPYPYCPQDVLFPVEHQQVDKGFENLSSQISPTLKVEEQVLSKQLLTNDSLGG